MASTPGLLYFYRSIVGSVVECSPATRAARVRFPDDASSVLPLPLPANCSVVPQGFFVGGGGVPNNCRRGGGWQKQQTRFWIKILGRKHFGDGGYRSPYLSHAKRALYHLSYVPLPSLRQQKPAYMPFLQLWAESVSATVWRITGALQDRWPSIAQLVERWTVVV